ncbi:hypothetical protein D3C87_1609650 [compost metagenome]
MTSGGTRESEQDKITACGFWPNARRFRSEALAPSERTLPEINRVFPFLSQPNDFPAATGPTTRPSSAGAGGTLVAGVGVAE